MSAAVEKAPRTTLTMPKDAPTSAPKAWEFNEEFDLALDVPQIISASARPKLPYIEKFFVPALPHILSGKQPHKFIPKEFFTERTSKADAVDGAYMKSKVRDQFNKWVKTLPVDTGKRIKIIMVERKGGEEQFPQAGLSVWLTAPN